MRPRPTLVELGCSGCSWYTVRQSLLRLIYTLTSRSAGRAGANIRYVVGKSEDERQGHSGSPPPSGLEHPDSSQMPWQEAWKTPTSMDPP